MTKEGYNRGRVYRDLQQYQNAIADYTKVIELAPDRADIYVSRGNIYYELQQYQNALADYNQAIEIDTNYGFAYYSRGLLYDLMEDREKALADLEKAVRLVCQQSSLKDCQKAQEDLRIIQTPGN
ncbi:MAG: tetratricopeptide repeat protein [Hydrococcus sp. RU_2_2]|nr:tetratricopeptide repeat protein [Hydrococcus sp. RU_2_2]